MPPRLLAIGDRTLRERNHRAPEHGRKHWQKKGADSKALQAQIRHHGAHDSDPVARSPRSGQHRSAVEGRVERRIRREREEKEERGDTQQEPDLTR